ncbi:MAG: peptide chain release factor N(5)-glutamine methyltransferase [Bacteroidales bacterium]|nr:peptide chain release factor N(5)-glutamine methyltransferase [Bacteroidales bacterium]
MLLKEFINFSKASLEGKYPSGEALAMTIRLCEEKLGVKSYTHIVEPATEVPAERLGELEGLVARLAAGEPLQYVLGFELFLGLRFNVSPAVLIPRPETEQLVKGAISFLKRTSGPDAPRILDLCTGSGCIAWSLAIYLPGASVTGVDISPEALSVARGQFSSGSLPAGVEVPGFVEADVLAGGEFGEFDFVISNPPYVLEKEKAEMRANVLDHEPALALFVPDDDPLKFYRAVALTAFRSLREGGSGMVEINEAFGPETAAVFTGAGFRSAEIVDDFRGRPRFVVFSK